MKAGLLAQRIVLLTAVLAALYGLYWAARPASPELAENNYASNMLRIERYCFGSPSSVALLGSSLTGRLLPSYFDSRRLGAVANLGLDGSGPALGLQILERGPAPPRLVVIEANLLESPAGPNDRTLQDAMTSFTFKLARWLPLLRVEARPSTRLYAWLKARRDVGLRPGPPSAVAPLSAKATGPLPDAQTLDRARQALRDRVLRLSAHGVAVALFRMPTGQPWRAPAAPDFADGLARELGLPLLDLHRELEARPEPLSYTDGVHLAGPSARLAARLLTELVEPWLTAVAPASGPAASWVPVGGKPPGAVFRADPGKN